MQEIYTSEQVAKILQIHPQTVLKFIREGKLKGSKVGRGYRVKASDIDKFLEETSNPQPKRAEIQEKIPKIKSEETIKVEINNPSFPIGGTIT